MGDFWPDMELVETRPNRDGLFAYGGAGVGKTHLASALMAGTLQDVVAQNARQAYVSALWTTVPQLLCDLRDTFGDNSKTNEKQVIEKHAKPELLVLDDLGAEKVSDWTGQSLYLLISQRLNDMKQTIITSNLSLAEIDAHDPRLASRLAGMKQLKMTGKDRRIA